MSNIFEEREQGYEAKWVHDEEARFKIMSLGNARLALWAAQLMHLPTDQARAYANAVLAIGVSGKNDPVFEKIRQDLVAAGIVHSVSTIRDKMKEFYDQAAQELTNG